MRTPIVIMLLVCGLSAACLAQQQDSKTLNGILNPDMTLAYPGQKKTFDGGGGNMKIRPYVFDKSTFATKGAFNTKGYTETHSFLGIKNPWLGSKAYKTKGADFDNNFVIKNADRKFDVKNNTMGKLDKYVDSGKPAEDKQPFYTKPFVIAKTPKSNSVDGISQDMLTKKLTISDVRELLNKNN